MAEFETHLSGLLRDRAADARPQDQLESIVAPLHGSMTAVRRGGRSWRPLLAAAAVVALIVGLVALNGRDTPESAGGPGDGGAARFSFVTPQVSLTADDFWIDANDRRFTSEGAEVVVTSDPGNSAYQTLELVWHEQGSEMRLNIYFQSDGTMWSSSEVRTYNGQQSEPDWVTFTGDFFRSPLGSPFRGSFDETATENGSTSHLHLEGLRLQAFLAYGPGGVVVPTNPVPTADRGTLVVPALAADLPDTGIHWAPADSLALDMATEILQHECMVSKGWDYPLRTADFWAAAIGGWTPDELFGIVSVAGARASGYHSSGDPSSDPQTVFANSLSEVERTRFYDDLIPEGPTVDITGPDGSVLSQRLNGGCFGVAIGALNPLYDSQEGLRQSMDGEILEEATALAAAAPAVVSALASWAACVQAAVGETAATPNELARRYALDGAAPTAHEKDVAIADATCQQQWDLWHVYHVTLAEAERAGLGEQVTDYDELTRQRVELVSLAREILAARGVSVPPLD